MAQVNEQYLRQVWIMTFRAMDDVKETVRTAAKTLSRAVAGLSRRLCDPELTSKKGAWVFPACRSAAPARKPVAW